MVAMPARVLPDKAELQKMLAQGLTHQQIADKVSEETGQKVRRSSVSAAIHRAGLSARNKRYPEEIPWTVREEHLTHYAVRMLRLLGRRRQGIENSEDMDRRLDAWLETLAETHSVVTYLPNTQEGFFYIDGEPDDNGLPIIEEPEL